MIYCLRLGGAFQTQKGAPDLEGRSRPGGMAERLKAAVLKTAEALYVSGGSNPSPSARQLNST